MSDPKPLKNYFAAVTRDGHIWSDTIRYRARDSRKSLAEIFIGWWDGDRRVETPEDALKYAKKRGFRIIKVDILPVTK